MLGLRGGLPTLIGAGTGACGASAIAAAYAYGAAAGDYSIVVKLTLRPLALGAVLWVTVGMSSLLLQLLSGQL